MLNMLRALLVVLLSPLVWSTRDLAPWNYNPVASPSQIIQKGNARFTVLTSRLIRMEYSNNAKFEDSATLAVVNRALAPATFTPQDQNGYLTIETADITLKYKIGTNFTDSTLTVTSKAKKFQDWSYGMNNDMGNLGGTIKSLDELGPITLNCSQHPHKKVHNELLHCTWGMASRMGWVTIEDHDTPLLDATDYPIAPDSSDAIDLYFFGYGNDYKGALYDYMQIGGKYSFSPRYSDGIWWSRWYDYNDEGSREIIESYQSRQIPLDILIFDMDWHTKFAWGGYTWDPTLFPNPDDEMSFIRQYKGLYTGVNLHDNTGVRTDEKYYNQMCAAIGRSNTSGNIPFDVVNSTYMRSLEDVVMKPTSDNKIDFWWIDWQQGGTQGGCTGGKYNPTILLNHVRHTDHIRRNENLRGLILARWGGYGSQRYPVGFSGDVSGVDWASMAYQPYFSLTAANVGYWWSHDTVGPPASANKNDGDEIFTRWIQWATVSTVFRTHDRGMSAGGCFEANVCGRVRIWDAPPMYFDTMRQAMRERVEMTPYYYNAFRYAYDMGISPMRPMYYDWPDQEMAYAADMQGNFAQYMLGDDLLMAPVVNQASANTGMAMKAVWLPAGQWIEHRTGMVYNATGDNFVLKKNWDIREIPTFARAGSIIPLIELNNANTIGNAKDQYTTLGLRIYPGAATGKTVVYEDDGLTLDYIAPKNKFTMTQVSYKRTGNTMSVMIGAPTGNGYTGQLTTRNIRIKLVNADPISKVMVGSKAINNQRYPMGSQDAWWYEGPKLQAEISVIATQVSTGVTIDITFADSIPQPVMNGLKGAFAHANWAHDHLDETRQDVGAHLPLGGRLATAASAFTSLGLDVVANVNNFMTTLHTYRTLYTDAIGEVLGIPGSAAASAFRVSVDLGRADHWTCAGSCRSVGQEGYKGLRVDAYGYDQTTPGAIEMYIYWNNKATKHLATTSTKPPAGYTLCCGNNNGWIMKDPTPGPTVLPMELWFNKDSGDYFTFASHASREYAMANGYVKQETLGYVKPVELGPGNPGSPTSGEGAGAGVPFENYAIALVESSFQ